MRVFVEKFEEWKSQIIIEVQDTGKWNFAKSAEEMLALKEMKMEEWFDNHKSIRGRGLFMIILKLADELYFKDAPNGGLIVWVKKNIYE
jgi:anti-sigma regulatory factor (Ser/Thr protein kinase)